MNEHSDINRLLSAYSGGDLSPKERELVKEHLVACTACRAEQADLQAALRLLRSSPTVEPPPWLTTRIMARVRAGRAEKTGWLQRIFFPLHIKLPLEAMALLLICVSGYYLSRSVETKLGGPQLTESPGVFEQQHKPAADIKETKDAAPAPQPAAPHNAPEKAADKAAPQPVPAQDYAPAAPATFAPAPVNKVERVTPSAGAGLDATGAKPAAESVDSELATPRKMKKAAPRMELQEQSTPSAAPPGRADSKGTPAAAQPSPGLIRLSLADAGTAHEAVRQAIQQSGGAVVEGAQLSAQRKLQARIPAALFPDLLIRLARLGRIVEQPASVPAAGTVTLVIVW